MIMVQALLIAGVAPAAIRTNPLDERSVYTIRLGKDEPTTCVFPAPIKALVGANVSTRPEDAPGVLLSHEPGAEYFSLRALKDNAAGALNVVFRGHVYAVAFATGGEPDQAVVFLDQPLVGEKRQTLTAQTLEELLERAKQHDRLRSQYPGMLSTLDRAQPETPTYYRGFTATIEDVVRFDAEDVLVFRIRMENTRDEPVHYDPKGLAVRLRREIFPAALAEASGAIPPKSSTEVYLVIAGAPGRGRTNLSVRDTYNVIVPHP